MSKGEGDKRSYSSQSISNMDSSGEDPINEASFLDNIDVASIDNASVDTASVDNCYQDSISVDNSSINVSIDLQETSESTSDLQEITQSILDLEGTQTTPTSLDYGSSIELQRLSQQVPSSPPPSYEHVLAESRLAQAAAAMDSTRDNATVSQPEVRKGVQIVHTSHSKFYKALSKQLGITCKMSDDCRCFDCQSKYFYCEYDQNEQEKTDGGLGAGTPMFISEVMQGSACTLL